MKWTNVGGDYLDANNLLNGPTHYASTTYPSIGPWDVTALVQKLLVDGNTGFFLSSATNAPIVASRQSATPPVLQITTTTGSFSPPCTVSCWTDLASYQTLSQANTGYMKINTIGRGAAFLKFDLSGITGTVTSATLSVTVIDTPLPQNYVTRVDYLKMPALIWDTPRQLGGVVQGIAATVANDLALASHPAVIFYPSFANQAACEAAGWSNLDFNGNPPTSSFVSWSQYGLTAMRFGSTTTAPDILSWRRFLGGSYTELYCRYLMKIDPDVYLGMNERGVKLPGFDSSFGGGAMSYRMEHLAQSPSNKNAYGYFIHAYDAEHSIAGNPSNAQNRPMNPPACLVAGRIYCIEQYVKMNTDDGAGHYNSDGIVRIWIDGVLMSEDTTRKIRADQVPIYAFFANFYHGGLQAPIAPIHYEFGGVCVATQYIGPPKKSEPSWLSGLAVNAWTEIPGTKLSDLIAAKPAWSASGIYGVQGPNSIFADYGGLSCDSRDSTLYGLAGGGHRAYAGNQAIKIKLSVDAPAWEEAAPPSDGSQVILGARVYADGRPSSRHSYYGNQFIEQRNRAMCFGTVAAYNAGNADFPNIVSFDPTTGLYEADGTYPDCPLPKLPDDGICKDPATEDVYVWHSDKLARWNQATNTWTIVIAGGIPLIITGMMAVDTRRNRLFVPSIYFGGGVHNPATVALGVIPGVITQQTYSGDTSYFPVNVTDGTSIVFVPHPTDSTQDCFLCRKRAISGGEVLRINASTFFIDTLATTGGASIPVDVGGGPYNRFLSVPGLNGIAYAPNWDSNVWFLKTT